VLFFSNWVSLCYKFLLLSYTKFHLYKIMLNSVLGFCTRRTTEKNHWEMASLLYKNDLIDPQIQTVPLSFDWAISSYLHIDIIKKFINLLNNSELSIRSFIYFGLPPCMVTKHTNLLRIWKIVSWNHTLLHQIQSV